MEEEGVEYCGGRIEGWEGGGEELQGREERGIQRVKEKPKGVRRKVYWLGQERRGKEDKNSEKIERGEEELRGRGEERGEG